jgi:hypothetical protein
MGGGGGGNDNSAAEQTAAEEARKAALRSQINSMFGAGGVVPANFATEEQALAQDLTGKYTDEAKLKYDDTERALRFGAANTGNIGGTAYADAQAKLNEQNRMGGTRIADSVQRAINQLRGARENTRLNSINLVNAGSGADAVEAASSGLRSTLANAQTAGRENLFGDLFQGLAFTKGVGDASSREQALAALYNKPKSTATFTPTDSTGRVINYNN